MSFSPQSLHCLINNSDQVASNSNVCWFFFFCCLLQNSVSTVLVNEMKLNRGQEHPLILKIPLASVHWRPTKHCVPGYTVRSIDWMCLRHLWQAWGWKGMCCQNMDHWNTVYPSLTLCYLNYHSTAVSPIAITPPSFLFRRSSWVFINSCFSCTFLNLFCVNLQNEENNE